jgi:pyruvate,orthophosphate dikinase
LANQEAVIRRVASEVMKERKVKLNYLVGTMIELPRAALTADQIAQYAEFFSFGTNDLTQTTFGFSRDDIGTFLPDYLDKKILPEDPFQSLDQNGVGQLLQIGIQKGRSVRPTLKVGICGEHGGDPASVVFCHKVGMDYVSCSPFRVPIARFAAAQAAVLFPQKEDKMAEEKKATKKSTAAKPATKKAAPKAAAKKAAPKKAAAPKAAAAKKPSAKKAAPKAAAKKPAAKKAAPKTAAKKPAAKKAAPKAAAAKKPAAKKATAPKAAAAKKAAPKKAATAPKPAGETKA